MRTTETTQTKLPRWNETDTLKRLQAALERSIARSEQEPFSFSLVQATDRSNSYGDYTGLSCSAPTEELANRVATFVEAWLSKHARCNSGLGSKPAQHEASGIWCAFVGQDYWSLGD